MLVNLQTQEQSPISEIDKKDPVWRSLSDFETISVVTSVWRHDEFSWLNSVIFVPNPHTQINSEIFYAPIKPKHSCITSQSYFKENGIEKPYTKFIFIQKWSDFKY